MTTPLIAALVDRGDGRLYIVHARDGHAPLSIMWKSPTGARRQALLKQLLRSQQIRFMPATS